MLHRMLFLLRAIEQACHERAHVDPRETSDDEDPEAPHSKIRCVQSHVVFGNVGGFGE